MTKAKEPGKIAARSPRVAKPKPAPPQTPAPVEAPSPSEPLSPPPLKRAPRPKKIATPEPAPPPPAAPKRKAKITAVPSVSPGTSPPRPQGQTEGAPKPKPKRKPRNSPRRTGRPTSYVPDVVRRLLRRLAQGETLLDICDDADMPHKSTVHDWEFADRMWKEGDPPCVSRGFSELYARARAAGLESENDEMKRIAANPGMARITVVRQETTGTGKRATTKTIREIRDIPNVEGAKLKIGVRQWRNEHMMQKYGRPQGQRGSVPGDNDGDIDREPIEIIIKGGLPD